MQSSLVRWNPYSELTFLREAHSWRAGLKTVSAWQQIPISHSTSDLTYYPSSFGSVSINKEQVHAKEAKFKPCLGDICEMKASLGYLGRHCLIKEDWW